MVLLGDRTELMSGVLAAMFGGSGSGGGSGGADVSLSALNWSDIGGSYAGSNETLTIAGINTTVTLTVVITGAVQLYYAKNGASTAIVSGGTLTVANADTLAWSAIAPGYTVSGTVTITNTSDGGAAVDSFIYDLTVPTWP